MILGMLLVGQKGQLYKVANQNEKALKEEKRRKIEELKRQRQLREAQQIPAAWKSAEPIQVTK